MKKKIRAYLALAVIPLSFILVHPAYSQEVVPEFIGGLRADAVWDKPDFFQAVFNCNDKYLSHAPAFESQAQTEERHQKAEACLQDYMKNNGASSQALAFLRFNAPIAAAIKNFKAYKTADVVNANILMADASSGFFLISKSGQVIPTYAPLKIEGDPRYQAFLKQIPQAMLWNGPDMVDWPKVIVLNGGERFIFRFPFLNGCHACAVIGYAEVGFDFDKDGKFLGNKLLGVGKELPGK